MSPADAPARPSQVTVAGWAIAVASTVVVLAVFQTMGDLNSVDMRDELSRSLTSGAAKELGISVDQALEVIRWCLYVAGVAAVVTGVLGIYVLQRNHAARIVLTLAAVPIVLTAPVAGSFPGMVVGAGAAMLWTRPARDWFAGRPITPPRPGGFFSPRTGAKREEPPAAVVPPAVPDVRMPEPQAPTPSPTPAWGTPPGPSSPSADYPPPTGAPVHQAAAQPWPAPYAGPPAVQMPLQVRLACVFTWIFGTLSGLGAAAMLVAVAVAHQDLVDQVTKDDRWDASLDTGLIVPAVVTFGLLVLVWCVLNVVLAYFVWHRRRGAWVGLSVSIGLAAVVSVVGFPFSLLHMAVLASSLGMLMSRPGRAWFADRR